MKREALRAMLADAGIRPRRSAGQNFLVEETLAEAIARDGLIESDDVVLEIGTGFGMLTQFLIPAAKHVLSVDLDTRLLALAREYLQDQSNLTLLEADALKSKNTLNPLLLKTLRDLLSPGQRVRVVANLPYNVATPLVVGLLREDLPLSSVTVMVQLEVAQRFAAKLGDEQFGAVSHLCSALCSSVEIVRKVPRDVFHPRPNVASAIVRLIAAPGRQDGFPVLSSVVRATFNYRRKTLGKALKAVTRADPKLSWLSEAASASEIDLRTRVDQVPLEAFQRLTALKPPSSTA
jgi:16S rRNA (adenine1518-N6/adenine1519-N6)-dimethyltransferase